MYMKKRRMRKRRRRRGQKTGGMGRTGPALGLLGYNQKHLIACFITCMWKLTCSKTPTQSLATACMLSTGFALRNFVSRRGMSVLAVPSAVAACPEEQVQEEEGRAPMLHSEYRARCACTLDTDVRVCVLVLDGGGRRCIVLLANTHTWYTYSTL